MPDLTVRIFLLHFLTVVVQNRAREQAEHETPRRHFFTNPVVRGSVGSTQNHE
jgi:hypothetical protein